MNSTLKNILFLSAGLSTALSILYVVFLQSSRFVECDLSAPEIHFENCVIPAEQLLINPGLFHKKTVMVKGIFNWGAEDNYIISEGSASKGQIWIEYVTEFYEQRDYEGRSKGILKGLFDKHDDGHLGQHQGTIYAPEIIYEY